MLPLFMAWNFRYSARLQLRYVNCEDSSVAIYLIPNMFAVIVCYAKKTAKITERYYMILEQHLFVNLYETAFHELFAFV